MNITSLGVRLTVYGSALGAVVAAAAAAATFGRGPAWGWGVACGGAAVGLDFFFLASFGLVWFAAARDGRRLIARGAAALAAKTILPPAVLAGVCWGAGVSPAAVAAGALAAATAAPICLLAFIPRRPAGGLGPS